MTNHFKSTNIKGHMYCDLGKVKDHDLHKGGKFFWYTKSGSSIENILGRMKRRHKLTEKDYVKVSFTDSGVVSKIYKNNKKSSGNVRTMVLLEWFEEHYPIVEVYNGLENLSKIQNKINQEHEKEMKKKIKAEVEERCMIKFKRHEKKTRKKIEKMKREHEREMRKRTRGNINIEELLENTRREEAEKWEQEMKKREQEMDEERNRWKQEIKEEKKKTKNAESKLEKLKGILAGIKNKFKFSKKELDCEKEKNKKLVKKNKKYKAHVKSTMKKLSLIDEE